MYFNLVVVATEKQAEYGKELARKAAAHNRALVRENRRLTRQLAEAGVITAYSRRLRERCVAGSKWRTLSISSPNSSIRIGADDAGGKMSIMPPRRAGTSGCSPRTR